MTGVLSKDLKAYFEEARRWDEDRLKAARDSRLLAWCTAGVFATLNLACTASVAALTPLKSVEPFVVRVNEATGAVDVMTGLKGPERLTYEEAVTKFFLAGYVRAREGYLPDAAGANFRLVSLMSTPEEQERWSAFFRGSNPKSPQVVYGTGGVAEIGIRAISFVSPKVANVRFHRTVRRGPQTLESDWIATLAFTYVKAPMEEADRLLNPLGFQVTSYRADPEVPSGA